MSPSLHDVRALTGEATQLSPTSLAIILSIIGVLLLGGVSVLSQIEMLDSDGWENRTFVVVGHDAPE